MFQSNSDEFIDAADCKNIVMWNNMDSSPRYMAEEDDLEENNPETEINYPSVSNNSMDSGFWSDYNLNKNKIMEPILGRPCQPILLILTPVF